MKKFLVLAASVASLALAASSQAALVTWSSYVASNASDTSWMSDTSTIVCAANFGGDTTTFAGITWGNDGNPLGYPSNYARYHSGSFDLTFAVPNVAWANAYTGFYAGGPDLLNQGSWFDNEPTAEINVAGLTIGQDYQIKLIVADTRTDFNVPGRTIDFGHGSGTMQYAFGDSRYLVATASFTADAGNIVFSGQQINAVSVAAVPEPASLALVGLGAIGLLARRRSALRGRLG